MNHYIKYGFSEGRNSFGTFDARAYADRYPDLKAAFGYDVLALYKHYLRFGRAEGRDASAAVAATSSYTCLLYTSTSHSFVSKRTAEFLGMDLKNSKIIVAHLGNRCV